MPFYDLFGLKNAYRQCLSVLPQEESRKPAGQPLAHKDRRARSAIVFYDSEQFYRDFIAHYQIDINHRWTIHPKVALLHNYDKTYNTDNVTYLKTFIESGCSTKRAAEVLHVHYNTLVYRITRMKEIAEIDVRSAQYLPGELFHILLSCKLLTD